MKKQLLTLFALLTILPMQAQFTLTDRGFVNSGDHTLGYYIIECPGMSMCAIAKSAAYFTESRFANPWTYFNGLECESFNVSGVAPESIYNGRRLLRVYYDMEFKMMIDFCDGFIRVWAPEIMSLSRLSSPAAVSASVGTAKAGVCVQHDAQEVSYLYVSENYRPAGARSVGRGSTAIFNRHGAVRQKYAKQSLEEYFNSYVAKLEAYVGGR